MRPVVTIRDSTWGDVLELKDDLREGEQKEIMAYGVSPQEGLVDSFRVSIMRRTALVDGKVAAMWGIRGTLLGEVGNPFLLTGHEALKVSPLVFTRVYINQLQDMKDLYPILENYVDASYDGAVKLLKLAGFKLEEVMIKTNLFYKFSMVN